MTTPYNVADLDRTTTGRHLLNSGGSVCSESGPYPGEAMRRGVPLPTRDMAKDAPRVYRALENGISMARCMPSLMHGT